MRLADHWSQSNWQAFELIIQGTKLGEIASGTGYWYDRAVEVFEAYEAGDWSACEALLDAARARFDSITKSKGQSKGRYPIK